MVRLAEQTPIANQASTLMVRLCTAAVLPPHVKSRVFCSVELQPLQAMIPTEWLNSFGHAINAAVNGDRGSPLPLLGEPARHWRLRLSLRCVGGLASAGWEAPYLKAKMTSAAVELPKCRWVERGRVLLASRGLLVSCRLSFVVCVVVLYVACKCFLVAWCAVE